MSGQETQTMIWDLDGTLIDSFGVFVEVLGDVLPTFNRQLPSRDFILLHYHGSLEDSIDAVLGGVGATEMESIVHDFLKVQNHHYEVIDHHIFPDALGLAKRAAKAGIMQVLVTNRSHAGRLNASPRNIVENSELRAFINVVIAGDDSEHRKPKPEVLGDVLRQLVPETTLVVGDQFVDAELANNLSTQAVLVARGGAEIPHLEKLGDGWQEYVTIVSSLDEVRL